ncbi:phosphate-repressible phosphate permease pho-4 [Physcia stellaris]|nr:phosphate-repressible phosphate permease pho-4 [Physcia stellaris]
MPAANVAKYDWIIALISIFFCVSSFGNGANDIANSYATSVAARTLTMPQVGFLSMITEFVGAVALGNRVTGTIKNGIITIDRFKPSPGVLILAMGCAEAGSATWLIIATRAGFPVSTTQTVVGALVGVGFAASAPIKWRWATGSVSQIAASWAIAPILAAAFAALLFATLKFGVLERKDPFQKAMRAIPVYLAFTCAILALFLVVEAPNAPSLEEFGAGKAAGIVLGVFFGCLAIAYIFFVPYFHRRLVKEDSRIKFWHIPLGPMLWKEDPYIYFPAKDDRVVVDHYENAYLTAASSSSDVASSTDSMKNSATEGSTALEKGETSLHQRAVASKRIIEPEDRFLAPVAHLSILNPKRVFGYVKFILLQGVTRDCVSHDSIALHATHERAKRYDNKVEHLWTYAQVLSAMIMSIAHGSNDVANAVGPWVAAYNTYQDGTVTSSTSTPIWILVIAGFLLGAGFWFFGFHIMRSLGNRITQLSPTRGYAMELGAAITVLLASRLALPVSTTQCLVGATMGVALMNLDARAVNWRQLAFILCGWILTLPCAGLISGLMMVMALNTPHL